MKYPASPLTPFPPAFPRKIIGKRIATARNRARAPATSLSTFKINTCKSVSKQRTLSSSRMNTYEKTGRGGHRDFVPCLFSPLLYPERPAFPFSSFHSSFTVFARPLFSQPYELLFPQLPCFHNHLNCPGVWGSIRSSKASATTQRTLRLCVTLSVRPQNRNAGSATIGDSR